ncbi:MULTISPECIES: RnfABCDGE type electron transport complex subunit G [Sporomusa]|jgi:electron transport complex protein RnfG|uniref:Ion-translocating oxidoreductase complex subunit G n=1 Tax=Sporomusa sphaeroides DSM 2875 TaxID=1337886 RepID=A0ABP2C7Y7_9FIRM|nr:MULTISPECIES: RnfABCDGE type electron transport complex subunit G [Sporomusa]MCM0758273.1 RnfABCDGE type electron transport complex subunit G [Sporomusa sphaeroides DSM 2875]OLS57899.1 electron transport complex subunit RnfG [Sporomusa sphaeroides DSM 2875]CVK20412.1 Electron transport complex protein RnfG [Sporomusa sphaeroides DSM 2875]HML31237.1 RnfABCDGE type electron transport complex subunit G [Sporomusa sphaeroides]
MSHDSGKNDSLIKIALNLTTACLISSVILSGVYFITAPYAAANDTKRKEKAMQAVIEDVPNKEFALKLSPNDWGIIPIENKPGWYKAAMKADGKVIAYIVPAASKGYSSVVSMIIAVSPEGKLLNFKVVSQAETPGLGDKFYEPKFYQQFPGKKPEDLVVVKEPTDKNIQAMTGATITTRAIAKGIREAAEEVGVYMKETQNK